MEITKCERCIQVLNLIGVCTHAQKPKTCMHGWFLIEEVILEKLHENSKLS